jgi:hypothetical protein
MEVLEFAVEDVITISDARPDITWTTRPEANRPDYGAWE